MGQGAFITGCAGRAVTKAEKALFREADPWGFILFARNIETPAQTRRLVADLRESVGRDAPVLIDQEGGRVQRLKPPIWRAYPPALDQVRATAGSVRAMYLRQRLISAELHDIGIDVNCVPCLDLLTDETHPMLANRLLGAETDEIVPLAQAIIDGGRDGGVRSVIKHLPGYGRASLDSHKALPRVDTPLAELTETDFEPFRPFADEAMGMTAHILFTDVDPDRPVTQSPDGIRLIREQIGFDGLLMTDDISMEALSGSITERSRASLAAGCDLVLHCNGAFDEIQIVAETCGAMTEASQARADRAVTATLTPIEDDIPALLAEYEALLKGA
ncbi:glycoside hydrolase family 3 N-terminal domain-containing protein [Aestuariibius sp. 2305UL40-4]|uniref:glycoside hydrolase family 3 N-terminal domain-containing protein n=1 Tax=Aestuariibius violaceus TaxID=3234132 RepID=UPI00345F151B